MSLSFSEKLERNVLAGLAGTLFLCSFFFMQDVQQGFSTALHICIETLIPSLFPMIFISNVLASSGIPALLRLPFQPLLNLMEIRENQCAGALMLGILGGFAVSSTCIASLYKQQALSARQAQFLLCCTCSMSPAFCIQALGAGMIGNAGIGVLLFISILCANFICAILLNFFRHFFLPNTMESTMCKSSAQPTPTHFSTCLLSALRSMAVICACVCIFYALTECTLRILPNTAVQTVMASLLEVTGACMRATTLGSPWRLYACCAALSLNGASAFLQMRAILPADISLLPVLAMRIVHLPCSLLLFKLLQRLFPFAIQTVVPAYDTFITRRRLPYDVVAIFMILLATLLCFSESIHGLHREKKKV